MAKQNRTTLKNYFQTGDIPSQAQYTDLIDSNLNLSENNTGDIQLTGNITASGNISSSGTEENYFGGDVLLDEGKAIFFDGTDGTPNTKISKAGTSMEFRVNNSQKLSLGTSDTSFNNNSVSIGNAVADPQNLFVSRHITASGNISSSGTGSFGELRVDRYIRHMGDNDTHIEFLDNKIQLHAGNLPFITIDKDSSTPHPLTINNGGNRINFRVQDKDSNLLLKTDSEAFKVNLYHAGNQKLETQTGGVNITGHITASGNLKIDGSQVDFTNLPTSDPGVAGRLYNDSGTIKISL